MVWIAAVLAVFLFYKFVDRSHKIVFFKICGGLTIIGIIVGAGFYIYEELLPKKLRSEKVTVEFESQKPSIDIKMKQKIAEKIFNEQIAAKNSLVVGLSANELEIAKYSYFQEYFPEDGTLSKVDNDFNKEFMSIVSAMAAPKDLSKEDPFALNKRLQDERLAKYEVELGPMRNLNKGRHLALAYILKIRLDTLEEEQSKLFSKQFSREELVMIAKIKEESQRLRKYASDAIVRLNLPTEINFKICNNEDKPLNSCEFFVSGFQKGRSTANNLEKREYGSDTQFKSDFIIGSKKCEVYTWTGKYEIFDRYEVKYVSGTWAHNP